MAESITKEMRLYTREIHKISDDLLNAKLAFALNSNDVWADGLLVFYEIFKYLEENVSSAVLPEEYHRMENFERDLCFYKGDSWKENYKPREAVCKYLSHLNRIKETNSLLLIPYVYHLYLGLLSGGQILVKKRQLKSKFTGSDNNEDEVNITPGNALLSFPDRSLFELKNNLKATIDEYAKNFDDDLRREMIVESQKVFELNNMLINSVEGVAAQNFKLLGYFFLVIFSIYVFMKMWAV